MALDDKTVKIVLDERDLAATFHASRIHKRRWSFFLRSPRLRVCRSPAGSLSFRW